MSREPLRGRLPLVSRRFNLSLRTRILCGVAATLAVGIGLLYVMGSAAVMDGFSKLERKEMTDSVGRVRDALNQRIDGIDTTILSWSDWDDTYQFVEDGNQAYLDSNLGDTVFSQLAANLFIFVDERGKVVWAKTADLATGKASETLPAGMDKYLASGGLLLSHPDLQAATKGVLNLPSGPMLLVSRAILTSDGAGPSHGSLIIGRWLDATEIAAIGGLTHLNLSSAQEVDGKLVGRPSADVRSAISSLSARSPVAVQTLGEKSIAGYALVVDLEGKPALILRAQMPRDVYAQSQQSLTALLVLLLLLGLAIFVVLFVILERFVVRGLGRLTLVADRVAQGDGGVQVEQTGRSDEIGEVARAFDRTVAYLREAAEAADRVSTGDLTRNVNSRSDQDELSAALNRMVVNLRGLIGQVTQSAGQVNGVARGVALSATELSGATSHVAQNVANVSQGTSAQGQQVAQILESLVALGDRVADVRSGGQQIEARISAAEAALGDLSGAIDGAKSAATEVDVVAASATAAAESGASSVRETVAGMGRIRDVVQGAASRVTELGAKGEQIGAIVETIDDIAEQTNLLALNAAIEAARAGEQGKGFAVVADEVRKLAERSSRATKEIASLIEDVQSGTEQAVAAMEAGAAEVSMGSELAARSGQAIEDLAAAVAATRSAAVQIGERIRIMSEASDGVVGSIKEIDRIAQANGQSAEAMLSHASTVIGQLDNVRDVTDVTARNAEEVNAAAEQMNHQAQSLAGSADTLVMTARAMARATSQFQLPDESSAGASATQAA